MGESITNPRKYFGNNVVTTLNLLDAMLDSGVEHIVFSSTCATYGMPERLPIAEEHPQRPVNPYGESKLFVERVLRWYGQAYGLKWMALLYFNAAGADPSGWLGEQHDPETHLIPLALRAAAGLRSDLAIYGIDYPTLDGTAVRDYVHVMDLAEAHVRALGHLQKGGESMALNLGTGQGHSVQSVVQAVQRITGRTVPVVIAPRRERDPPELVADARRACDVLGWSPAYPDLDFMIETAWEWQRIDRAQRLACPAQE